MTKVNWAHIYFLNQKLDLSTYVKKQIYSLVDPSIPTFAYIISGYTRVHNVGPFWSIWCKKALAHTIQKCKKMAWQNTFQILFLNDAHMIGEH